MQKPFTINKLIDTIEDREVYDELQKFNVDIDIVKAFIPTHQQIIDLLEKLRRIQKNNSNTSLTFF
jgi:hypothetical protein